MHSILQNSTVFSLKQFELQNLKLKLKILEFPMIVSCPVDANCNWPGLWRESREKCHQYKVLDNLLLSFS